MTKQHEMFIELFNKGSHQSYEETRAKAIWDNESNHIEISSESLKSFHHLEAVIRIARGLDLKSYAKVEEGKVIIIVF